MLYTNFTLFKGLGEMKLNTRERERGREGGREGGRERERERERETCTTNHHGDSSESL